MILDHRGRPAAAPQLGFGFVPSVPVLPRRRPAKATETNELDTTAIGFAIAHPADEETPPDDE